MRIRAIIYFLEQNTVKIKNAVVEGVHHTVHGLKDFGKDSKWLISQKYNKDRFQDVSSMQRRRESKIIEDFLKMIPFSFFLLIPGAELLLPFWLSIFPNSLPS